MYISAKEVMERLSGTRHPRDLEAEIGPAVSWIRTEFRSVMPVLHYLEAKDRGEDARADQIMAEATPGVRCFVDRSGTKRFVEHGSRLESTKRVQEWLKCKGKTASETLSVVGPKMDEVLHAEDARIDARIELQKMVQSGKVQMLGRKKAGGKRLPIDSDLFWFSGRGDHVIDADYDRVLTRSGTEVYHDLQFRTGEVDAYLPAEGGAAVREDAPQVNTTTPEAPPPAAKHKTGPRPKKIEAAMESMQLLSTGDLHNIQVDDLVNHFPAHKRTTLYEARKRVLSSNSERNSEYSELNTGKK